MCALMFKVIQGNSSQPRLDLTEAGMSNDLFGWHYLSKATCLIRPPLLYALFVVSRTITICPMIRHL